MKIALCFSGHLRNFNLSVDNIIENIITPLKNNNTNEVDIFISTWDTNGQRHDNWSGSLDYIDEIKTKLNPKSFEIEKENRNYFVNNYSSLQYRNFSLCSSDTCSNASSMWYKAYKCFQLMKKYSESNNFIYDIVIRIRPDIIYHNKINYNNVLDCLKYNKILMPKWHGKYEEVTFQLMDHFTLGPYVLMEKYLSTYLDIPEFIKSNDIVHCAEGFLFGTIKKNNINITRSEISYSVIRKVINNEITYEKII